MRVRIPISCNRESGINVFIYASIGEPIKKKMNDVRELHNTNKKKTSLQRIKPKTNKTVCSNKLKTRQYVQTLKKIVKKS